MTRSLRQLLLVSLCSLTSCKKPEVAPDTPKIEVTKDSVVASPNTPWLDYIKTEPVKDDDVGAIITVTGRVTFDEDHTQRVASPVDGRVQSLLVVPGDKVRAGQPLLDLSSPQVAQIQADAQKAQQDFSLAEKSLERVRKLKIDGAISEKEAAQVEADYKKSKADVTRTTAQLNALHISASDPAVRISLFAQIPGTVVERNVLVGQEVRADAAQPLVTITSLDTLWVLADVYEQDLGLVQKQDSPVQVRVSAYPGENFPGQIKYVGDVIDTQTRTVKVRCVVPNAAHKLKPEMFAKVDIKDNTDRKVLVVSSKAILSDGDKSKVVVANAGGVFRMRTVEVGPEVEGKVRVLSGLDVGEVIVTEGALFVAHEIEDK